ncbi:MAG: NAD+ synthase [Deltaproteobacteria bacterium]|nr:NAD+ synthase [Candidatus Anaeroferrophillus wilburensis]MBN2887755.1 NAD+ synthase [Deltaproteobacteria bacterium]
MKIALAQLNPTVGDIDGNLGRLQQVLEDLRPEQPDLVVCPELYLTGYPPRDLLERTSFIDEVEQGIRQLCLMTEAFPGLGLLLGTITRAPLNANRKLHNSAVLIAAGEVIFTQHKSLLPVYDVFDEQRYFEPAATVAVCPFKGETLGISICEDAWNNPELDHMPAYAVDPIALLAKQRATVLINLSASPFQLGKEQLRQRIISSHAKRHQLPFILVNQVGGNDELIFDGQSLVVNRQGSVALAAAPFTSEIRCLTLAEIETLPPQTDLLAGDDLDQIRQALILGIRDYFRKCGFHQGLIGLSGGIDSALVCCLAVEALGKDNVWGVSMPSPFSSRGSIDDARKLAENLGIQFAIIPINTLYEAYLTTMKPLFAGRPPDVTEENIQARIRGSLLMALSNKFGHLVLATGNKSELAVGYCTLYGDMCGGLSVISDLPKTTVYRLAERLNRAKEIIPRETISKPPSAELRPDQKDQDTLPPYDILDQILALFVDQGKSAAEIIGQGFAPETVTWVARAVYKNEYKRRQAAPGLKVTSKAFGMGRRIPIAAHYTI